MRNLVGLGLGLVLAAAACGTGGSANNDDTPDAAGSGSADANPNADLAPPPAGQGFQLRSPDIVIPAGSEHTYCWYTTVPLTADTGVKKWESHMTTGSHHLIVFMTPTQENPDGTLVDGCGVLGNGNTIPVWSYSAQTEDQEAPMPTGVGMTISANQHLFVQLHYLNTTDADLTVHSDINGWTYASTDTFTPAAAFVTYNTNIDIPAGVGMTATAQASCTNTPTGTDVNFFTMSSHSHQRSVHTYVYDGTTEIVDSTDWQHPTIMSYDTNAPTWNFYHFQNQLSWRCDYINNLATEVHTGDSAATDEMCMAVGYFFPATGGPIFCLN